MTFERNPGPRPSPARTPIVGAASPGSAPTPVSPAPDPVDRAFGRCWRRRSLAWNEIFSRAGMYLSTLSGSMVAIGLIAGSTNAGDIFFAFAFVILPVELFIGVATLARMRRGKLSRRDDRLSG